MTPKQILDSFSETLIQDERILSAQERQLLTNLLSHAKDAASDNLEMQEAVRRVIANAVGETVAQRAFSALGESIVERILGESEISPTDAAETLARKSPSPPGKAPTRTPGVRSNPVTPSTPGTPGTPGQPQGPQSNPLPPTRPLNTPISPATPGTPGQPQGPQASFERIAKAEAALTVQVRPPQLKARCVVLDEFLAPQEVEQLMRFAVEHETSFRSSEVISPIAEGGVVDYEHRRSRVLMETGPYQDLVLKRIKAVLPSVLRKLGMEEFTIAEEEVQITASNDGDFFRFHSDNGSIRAASRCLTFVYFFHREPRQFEGGELRIHDARLEGEQYVSDGSYQAIPPQQNQIVFFPCELLHEITPVDCPSGQFADSRFTLNGWLRR